jgi:vacuolar iron transporter family protein
LQGCSRKLRSKFEQDENERHFGREVDEPVELFTSDELPEPDVRMVAATISRHPGRMLRSMADAEDGGNLLQETTVMAVSFRVGAIVPIVPWILTPETPLFSIGPFGPSPALLLSVIATALVLFGVGALKGRLARTSAVRSGLQVAVIELGCAVVAYV